MELFRASLEGKLKDFFYNDKVLDKVKVVYLRYSDEALDYVPFSSIGQLMDAGVNLDETHLNIAGNIGEFIETERSLAITDEMMNPASLNSSALFAKPTRIPDRISATNVFDNNLTSMPTIGNELTTRFVGQAPASSYNFDTLAVKSGL
ncbi:MAG: hypothetical protein U5J95_07695 [Balneolaceae bacterium]|nr:hypothetical protein [Balneolaceae bacterium]